MKGARQEKKRRAPGKERAAQRELVDYVKICCNHASSSAQRERSHRQNCSKELLTPATA